MECDVRWRRMPDWRIEQFVEYLNNPADKARFTLSVIASLTGG